MKNKNNELQSRREFFKKAAKGILPLIGGIILAGSPSIVKAAAVSYTHLSFMASLYLSRMK